MTNWSDSLYTFGYLLTNDAEKATNALHALNNWKQATVGAFHLFVHPKQRFHLLEGTRGTYLLVGHACNPFTMEADEDMILRRLSSMPSGSAEYRDYFDQLTGIFFYAVIADESVTATCDCAGMLGANYAKIGDHVCFSAYSQMIADIYGLSEDPYVKKLKESKLFHWYGWYLPGNLTPYQEVKRIVPNTEIRLAEDVKISRFYPRKHYDVVPEKDYPAQVQRIGGIMHNTMRLILQKWQSPAVSLTGGTDSKTTLACAKGIQERFRYFSYVSLPREETDAFAARDICKALGLNHRIYYVDADPKTYPEYDEVSDLLQRHYSFLGKANENDICKRISLKAQIDFDVEVKSWVSEVARASRHERYGRKTFPQRIPARYLTSMYKIFALDRMNAVRTDHKFREYLEKTDLRSRIIETSYPWSELFVWEIVFGGWGGLALTGEHMLTNEITVPYNNRALLDMMLRTPLDKRLHDHLHKDLIHLMDERIEQTGIHVVNGNETKKREIMERIYFHVHNLLPL